MISSNETHIKVRMDRFKHELCAKRTVFFLALVSFRANLSLEPEIITYDFVLDGYKDTISDIGDGKYDCSTCVCLLYPNPHFKRVHQYWITTL